MTVRVRDGLEAYAARAKEAATEGFRHAQFLYVMGGLKKAPKLPSILE